MNLYLAEDNEFIENLSKIIFDNLSNENFGVKEFIIATGLNRNYLSRRIKSIRKITINQFIAEVRLEKAREFLLEGTYTASEVSYNVGFSSPSYFTRCFHDFYGYAPREVKNHLTPEKTEKPESKIPKPKPARKKRWVEVAVAAAIFMVVVVISSEVFFFRPFVGEKNSTENTIAIMPFINDSGEEFAPFIAWMGIEIGNKLGKIKNMLVVPQSTTENYSDSKKSNRDIARELMVDHLLRGRTIKTGDKILLNVELLDAKTGQSILSEMYERDLDETEEAGLNRIFEICGDVVLQISEVFQTNLTAEEKKQVAQKSTQNPEALQYFLQGNQLFLMLKNAPNKSYTNPNRYIYINEAIKTFEKCINLDSTYSDAYIKLAHIYFDFLYPHTSDLPLRSLYQDSGMIFIEKALHFNKNHVEANASKKGYLISKGLYSEAEKLTPILAKQVKNAGYYMTTAMEYYELQDFYHFFENISKYYEFKPVSEIIPPFLFNIELMCYNATGFPELSRKKNAEWFANMNDTALYDDLNVLIEIRDGNYQRALELTETRLKKYPGSIQFMNHEVLIRNYLRDYDKALKVMILLEKETEKRSISPYATSYIHGYTYLKNGMTEKALPLFEGAIKNFEEQIKYSSWEAKLYYSHFCLAKIYAARNSKQQSIYYLGLMKKATSTPKLFICDLKNDPMFDNVRQEPEFQKITRELEKKYTDEHEKIKKLLISKGLEPA
jgi:AraC-like DNA-binding protein/TolB-like protein